MADGHSKILEPILVAIAYMAKELKASKQIKARLNEYKEDIIAMDIKDK